MHTHILKYYNKMLNGSGSAVIQISRSDVPVHTDVRTKSKFIKDFALRIEWLISFSF